MINKISKGKPGIKVKLEKSGVNKITYRCDESYCMYISYELASQYVWKQGVQTVAVRKASAL